MILRGVYTCGFEDQDYFYSEKGGGSFSPEAYERFVGSLPPGEDRIQERLHRLFERSDEEGKRKWFWVLAAYEYSFFGVSADELDRDTDAFRAHYAEMRINCHYQANRFFLEDEQILRDTSRIQQIPTTIVHGACDVICPPRVAWRLHRMLPRSNLVLVDGAGHLSSEPGIEQALLAAVADFARRSSA
jgi:proline iminopeptidase